ncbi:unnamed protein product [Cylicocyclus nassatus]|uniref:Uncharacterized protein n=1 Tax=Cylicocyclus nassatus TaxID=53992 RepID=A0AA36GUJ2_CYLNA|nr:unnamed protein product [Cylicocyclus nassatus]
MIMVPHMRVRQWQLQITHTQPESGNTDPVLLNRDKSTPTLQDAIVRFFIRLARMAETLCGRASYRPSEFFGELADLFDKLKDSLGLELDEYLVLVKQYVKRKLTLHQLRHCVLEVLADECLYVHDRFIQVLSKGCHLDAAEKVANVQNLVPPAAVVNALLVLRCLENGWAVPDPSAGHLLSFAIKGIMADRIDCAAHVMATSISPQSQDRSFHKSKSTRKASPLNEITIADLYDSFSNCEHPVGSKTSNFLRMKCHADFFLKLESSVIEKSPQAATARTSLHPKSLPTAETSTELHFTRIPDDVCMEVLVATEVFDSIALSVVAVQEKIRTPVEEPSSRISRTRAREHASQVAPSQAVNAKAFLLKPGLEQHLEKVELPIEARPQVSGITSFSTRTKPVKRKLSGESDALSSVQQSKAMPGSTSRPSRKSAKVIPQVAGPGSVEASYSYTAEGAHVVKEPTSTRLPQVASQRVPTIVREGVSAVSKHHVSFERDMPSPPPAEPMTKFSSRSAEDLYRKVVEFSSGSKRNRAAPVAQPTTTKSRARKSEGTAATRHSPRVSTAQAIIDAWRASSFEVLPPNSFISPTKRDTSATKELFRDLPKKSSIDDSVPIGKPGLRSGKEAKTPAASTSKDVDKVDEKTKGDVSKKQSKDRKIEQNVTNLPSDSQKDRPKEPSNLQKDRPKEPGNLESRRKIVGDSKKPAAKEVTSAAKESPSKVKSEKLTSRTRSPQKIKMGLGEAGPSTAPNKGKLKPAKPSGEESRTSPSSRRRNITSESSPYSSPERMRSADQKQGKKSGKHSAGKSDKPSSHRSPTQQPKVTQPSKIPVEFSIPSIQNYKIPKLPKAQTSSEAKPVAKVGGTSPLLAESNVRVTRSAKDSVSFSSGDDSDLHDASVKDGRNMKHKKVAVKNLPQKSAHSASMSQPSSLEKLADSRYAIGKKKDGKDRARTHEESRIAPTFRSSSQSSMDDDRGHSRKSQVAKQTGRAASKEVSASKRTEKHRSGRNVSGEESSESTGERRSRRR